MSNVLRNIVVYCKKEVCGDPVVGNTGQIIHNRRQMVFNGLSWSRKVGIYSCPVCGAKRRFKIKRLGTGWKEI